MTNEQREAIELLEGIRDNTWTTKYIMSSDSKKAGTVLSLIKEQQEEMENITTNYEDLIAYVSGIAKELGLEEDATIDEIYIAISILKSKRINVIEQLDCIQKKDKQIDLMAESIELQQYANIDTSNLDLVCEKLKCNKKCELVKKDCIKQYFADKVNSSEQN